MEMPVIVSSFCAMSITIPGLHCAFPIPSHPHPPKATVVPCARSRSRVTLIHPRPPAIPVRTPSRKSPSFSQCHRLFGSLQSELLDELGENPLYNVEVLKDQLEFFP
ncbi:hypothetical protein SESBI_48457 [Sesbania bispinosa]|nr:hypothetical protein SESBI_48457 [Sesbania bispinosa]